LIHLNADVKEALNRIGIWLKAFCATDGKTQGFAPAATLILCQQPMRRHLKTRRGKGDAQ
jgi:hypothetical protein